MKTDKAIEAKPFDIRYEDLGEIAYNAVRKQVGGLVPPWEELQEPVRAGWLTVGVEVAAVMVERLYDVAKKIDQLSGEANGQIQ